MTDALVVTAELDDHVTRAVIPAREYNPNRGAWVRCATCDGIHVATVEEAA